MHQWRENHENDTTLGFFCVLWWPGFSMVMFGCVDFVVAVYAFENFVDFKKSTASVPAIVGATMGGR